MSEGKENNQMENFQSTVQITKIQNVLNSLNNKILKFDEQKKLVETEVGKQIFESRSSLVTDRTLTEISEMISI